MKKKIKDLNLEEFYNFCNKQPDNCVGCPFNNIEFYDEFGCDLESYFGAKDALNKQFIKYPLEQEIEVEEYDK